jgi:hypothetical protein
MPEGGMKYRKREGKDTVALLHQLLELADQRL